MIIAPSILNADNLNLGRDIKKATQAGITRFHIDIMDGHLYLICHMVHNLCKTLSVSSH